jgi:hypothetical protein
MVNSALLWISVATGKGMKSLRREKDHKLIKQYYHQASTGHRTSREIKSVLLGPSHADISMASRISNRFGYFFVQQSSMGEC